MHPTDPLDEARAQLRRAIDLLGYDDHVYEVLASPDRVLQVRITIKMDDGTVKTFLGWRSQHNSALGPYKGGVRYHPNVTMNEVIALSMWMTWKNSLAGLPYGGGKGGVRVNPKILSPRELELLSRKYFESISDIVGVDQDIPAPDVYTDPQVMSWFLDEYNKVKRGQFFGVVTGKPVELGGLNARIVSTGYGVAVSTRVAAEKFLGGLEGRTVAVQGYGNVGYYAAKFLAEMGAKIVAVSDSRGGVYDPEGIDPEEALKVKRSTGTVANYQGGKKISTMEILELPVDILVPAAIEEVITEENADRIKAKIISEGANGPTTTAAEKILVKKGIIVLPDILANAGGVIMSHIEWVNNRMGGWITDEEALNKLEQKMVNNTKSVITYWEKKLKPDENSLRDAAYMIAVERVVKAMKLRGWI
ncbi:NADP-dependent glutamate dehydrogenase [Aeropyrum camini SY1 = JCM 12091]|uniref:Glutamate dehydrogenase n=1 Tax=Aeropyrum camini SY1 = JCM 12091 TaxID=1198449 RepID=U3TG93_9CREN|nr:NADP-dependent glutamate dehydrogenase [Aeropyrum camini SY1 = JCM 12091]